MGQSVRRPKDTPMHSSTSANQMLCVELNRCKRLVVALTLHTAREKMQVVKFPLLTSFRRRLWGKHLEVADPPGCFANYSST